MTGFSVQVNGGPAMPLATGYSDGFWTTIKFDEPGTYVLRMMQAPHKLYQWEDTFACEGSYIIHVRR